MAVDGADGGGQAAAGGAAEKAPQSAGGQAEASDLVGAPDAEGPPATAPCLAIAAKEPPRADGGALVALVIAAQKAMANQRADDLAVRAGRLFEPFRQCEPFRGAAVEPALL